MTLAQGSRPRPVVSFCHEPSYEHRILLPDGPAGARFASNKAKVLMRRRFAIHTGRIAVLNPLSDYGINQYVYELCEGLAEHGVTADVYTSAAPGLPAPRRHRRFSVMGSVLFKQRSEFANPKCTPPSAAAPNWLEQALRMQGQGRSGSQLEERSHNWRKCFLTVEFLAHLRSQNYDWVWSQWPYISPYSQSLFRGLTWLGLPLVHTVHNVLPHEEKPEDLEGCGQVYRAADALIVHSKTALAELSARFPDVSRKAHIVNHMSYTLFPRIPGARVGLRGQLGLGPNDPLAIMCGAVRPYKNVDGFIEALSDRRLSCVKGLIAGLEAGYPDVDSPDPLRHTRRLVSQFGICDRVRLIPRFLSIYEMAELFEAADLVLLPYRHGSGSGQLMLAMTFGKVIVATGVGGTDEYLSDYESGYLVSDPSAAAIVDGIKQALTTPVKPAVPHPKFHPVEVARTALTALGIH